jgi:hypothetical protein
VRPSFVISIITYLYSPLLKISLTTQVSLTNLEEVSKQSGERGGGGRNNVGEGGGKEQRREGNKRKEVGRGVCRGGKERTGERKEKTRER